VDRWTYGGINVGKTSSAVKQRYNEKVYKQVNVQLKKELVEQWTEKLQNDGISKAEFIRNAIEEYLAK
jgi:predicted DNA binding CopG/RHH family protein